MRTRRISQLSETTANVHPNDSVTVINSSPLNNYKVTVQQLETLLGSSLWIQNELDGGFSHTVPVQTISADGGANG